MKKFVHSIDFEIMQVAADARLLLDELLYYGKMLGAVNCTISAKEMRETP